MNVHKNARLAAHSRADLVRHVPDDGQPRKVVAAAFGVDTKTVGKCKRFRSEGPPGLADRSSRPKALRRPTPVDTVEQIIALRRQRWMGQQVARDAKVSPPR
ncbi:MAG: family transposase [Caulobacteraceae bacterium]|nr:family transposase [Caulobacteraceae bacterium]